MATDTKTSAEKIIATAIPIPESNALHGFPVRAFNTLLVNENFILSPFLRFSGKSLHKGLSAQNPAHTTCLYYHCITLFLKSQ